MVTRTPSSRLAVAVRRRRTLVTFLVTLLATLLVAPPAGRAGAPAPAPPRPISVWTHEDANSAEFGVLRKRAERFNREQRRYRVELTSSLRRDYESWVLRAANAGTLPCLLDFDGPYLASLAWPQFLQPIERFVPDVLRDDFLPSVLAQGSYQGRLYSLAQFDSGVALWGNRRLLRAAGVRVATLAHPWSLAEFEDALERLSRLKEVDYPISFSIYNGRGSEFYTYSYAPLLQSFGGDLLARDGGMRAAGTLDGPASVRAMRHLQRWIGKGWTRAVRDRADDFEAGRTALWWNGHWAYMTAHWTLGPDLVLMPLPDFGNGVKTGMGSWAWGISSTCHEAAGAWAFLARLLSADTIVRMTDINGAVPARRSALARSALYGPGGPSRLIVRQLASAGVPRPATPAYGTVSAAFRVAVDHIVNGADAQAELSLAARRIDQTIAANRGYPYP